MIDDAAPIRDTLSESLPILENYLGIEEAKKLSSFIEDRLAEFKPTVMVYGIFNSGKSTLLNALLGQDLAPVANRPETDKVNSYEWEGFHLLDTPGIDASPEQEDVTRKQLENTDVILFVMDSSSTFEEENVYAEIANLMAKGKRLMIIINDKSGLSNADAERFRIHHKILGNIQAAVLRRGRDPGEYSVWVRMVDAKTGLRGRIENKPSLVKVSQLIDLERDLKIILGEAGFHDVVNTVGEKLLEALDHAIANAASEDSNNSPARRISEYDARLNAEKARVESEISKARLNAVDTYSREALAIFKSLQIDDLLSAIFDTHEKIKGAIERELKAAKEKFPELIPLRKDIDRDFKTFAREIKESTPLDSERGNTDSGEGISSKLLKILKILRFLSEVSDVIPAISRNPYVQAATVPLQFLEYVLQIRLEKQSEKAAQLYNQLWAEYVAQSVVYLNEFFVKEVQLAVDEAFEKAENSARERKRDLDNQGRAVARHREELSAHHKYVRRHLDYMRRKIQLNPFYDS